MVIIGQPTESSTARVKIIVQIGHIIPTYYPAFLTSEYDTIFLSRVEEGLEIRGLLDFIVRFHAQI